MVSGQAGVQPRFGPSNRILELAQHKTSKTIWATTPRSRLHCGPQQPSWPVSASGPSARIQYLARHKRDFSAREDPHRRKDEAARFFRKSQRPSSGAAQYENTVRLSTPRTRRTSQEAGPHHTPRCEINCPVWHADPNPKASVASPRLLQLCKPKPARGGVEDAASVAHASVAHASSGTPRISRRVAQLSLPRLKGSEVCYDLGPPEESIWTVSRAAKNAAASVRLLMLAEPKPLSRGYVPPREPEWRRENVRNVSAQFESH